MVREEKSDPESIFGTRSPPNVNQFFPLVGPVIIKFQGNRLTTFAVILLTAAHKQTHKHTTGLISQSPPTFLTEVIILHSVKNLY